MEAVEVEVDHRTSAQEFPDTEPQEEPTAFTLPVGFKLPKCRICRKGQQNFVMKTEDRPAFLKDRPAMVLRCDTCGVHTTMAGAPTPRLAGPKKISKRRLRILSGGRKT